MARTPQHIGIYAGTFDPIHMGHVQFVLEAIRQTELDMVYFLVEPRPRYKQGVKAFEHRVEMVHLAIQDQPKLGLLVLKQARFTVHETWPVLKRRFEGSQLSMLMGNDVFSRLSDWPRLDEIVGDAEFVVGIRAEVQHDIAEHVKVIEDTKHVKIRYTTFHSPLSTESSRKIRNELRRGIMPDGLDSRVAGYIREHELYSGEFLD